MLEISSKNCLCPICGHEFDQEDVFFGMVFCPTLCNGPFEQIWTVDELIDEWADYAWCQ